MFADELRRAVEASPRIELPKVSALLWKAYAAGQVTDDEANSLVAIIEARKAGCGALEAPHPRRLVGSRPRAPESLARRRRWAASGFPPYLQLSQAGLRPLRPPFWPWLRPRLCAMAVAPSRSTTSRPWLVWAARRSSAPCGRLRGLGWRG